MLCRDHQDLLPDGLSSDIYAHLERVGKPAYLGAMIKLDLLEWLEGKVWDVKIGGWFLIFKFEDPDDAVLFKLTWL